MRIPRLLLTFGLLASICPLVHAGTDVPVLAGSWTIDREASSPIDPWGRITLDIAIDGKAISISRTVTTGRRNSTQVYPFVVGEETKIPVTWWTGNRHIGAYMGGDGTETITAEWMDGGRTLRVESRYVLQTSQGETAVRSYYEYRLDPDGSGLTVIELRSSRSTPVVHVFKRA
ncbi:MAG: hypothetical protein AB3N64_03510 [Puniceicoccaceae bacterium]